MSKSKAYSIVEGILLIIIGILMACSIVEPSILNYLLGGVALIFGLFLFIKCATESSKVNLLLPGSMLSAVLVALGIGLMINYFDFVGLLTHVIVLAILAIGIVFILDSIIKFVNKHTKIGVIELLIGAILIIFAILLMTINEIYSYLWVITGILICIYGVYYLAYALVKRK